MNKTPCSEKHGVRQHSEDLSVPVFSCALGRAHSLSSHMNTAFPKRFFDALGMISLLDTQQRLQRCS